jgi:hypothetical protein
MVEDDEAKRREEPWLHMGILQGMHWVGIHSKEFRLYLKMQAPWPCECNRWQLAPICEGVFRTYAWNLAYAWVRMCVPLCDGAFDLGQVQAWGELVRLTIWGHHKSGKFPNIFKVRGSNPKATPSRKRSLSKGADLRGMPMGSPKRRVSIAMKLGITPKIAPNLNWGVGVRR